MKTKIIILIIILAVVVIATAAYLVIKRQQAKPDINATNTFVQTNKSAETEKPITVTPIPTPTPAPAPAPAPVPPVVTNKTYYISLQGFAFNPSSITINKGDIVIWTNKDSAPHTISGSVISSSTFNKGQTFSFKFNNAGTFNYICSIHPSMKGTVIVK